MPIWLEYLLFAVYVLVGPFAWGFMIVAMFDGWRRMDLFRNLPAAPQVWPRVTVLVPAKDEAGRIEACMRGILKQDYPNLRVVAVDDRSGDGTGEILDRVAREDDRLAVVHLVESDLEAGWMGKNHALRHGYERGVGTGGAGGDYLLFHDSDLRITDKATISLCVRAAVAADAAVFSLLPALESHSLFEGLILPLGGMISSSINAVALTNRDKLKQFAYANGQFMMVRRDVYDAIGGHHAVKARYCEDVAMARIIKDRGGHIRVGWGVEHLSVRMYDSLASVRRGLARIFTDTRNQDTWPIWVGILFVLVCGLSVYAAGAWTVWRWMHPVNTFGSWGWLFATCMHFVLMTAQLGMMYVWSKNKWWNALLFPVAAVVLLSIYLKALRQCMTGRYEWRGTVFTVGAGGVSATKAN